MLSLYSIMLTTIHQVVSLFLLQVELVFVSKLLMISMYFSLFWAVWTPASHFTQYKVSPTYVYMQRTLYLHVRTRMNSERCISFEYWKEP